MPNKYKTPCDQKRERERERERQTEREREREHFWPFFWCGFGDRGQKFVFFTTWLPHHKTYEVIIIIKAFHMSGHSDDENFLSIRQAVAEKNTHVLCGQTNE